MERNAVRLDEHGFYEPVPESLDTLRATVQTLLGRVESLERAVAGLKAKEQDVRRAVGQLASAYDVLRK